MYTHTLQNQASKVFQTCWQFTTNYRYKSKIQTSLHTNYRVGHYAI